MHEFVLLQNQGSLRICLKGHLVLSDSCLEGGDLTSCAHIFADDVLIPPGMYVLLSTGCGEAKWTRSKDGALIYYAYMNRELPVWDRCSLPLHLLNTQHSFTERREPVLLLR